MSAGLSSGFTPLWVLPKELPDQLAEMWEIYPEVPQKVECLLTDYGKTMRPITEVMCEWGQRRIKRIKAKKK